MNKIKDIEVAKVSNGYTTSFSYMAVKKDGEDFERYERVTNIHPTWDDVLTYLKDFKFEV